MNLQFRGCPMVLYIELSVGAWYEKTRRVLRRARRLMLLFLTAESRQRRRAVCGGWSGSKIAISYQSKHLKIPPHPEQPRSKMLYLSFRNPMYLPGATINAKRDMSDIPRMQTIENRCTSQPGSRVSEHIPRRPPCVCLPE